jgi:acyl-CoA synthetase (NDP forming)
MPRSRTLSEHASRDLLRPHGVPFARAARAADPDEAATAAAAIGFPVVVKLGGDRIAHKTERGLVRLGLRSDAAVRDAARELLALARPDDGDVHLLVAEQVRSVRELLAGIVRDPAFGPCVVLGVGGVLAEALGDVVFATAPLAPAAAEHMIDGLRLARLLTEPCRGEPPVDRAALGALLVALGDAALAHPEVASADLNPILTPGGRPLAVDALVEVGDVSPPAAALPLPDDAAARARFEPLFHPRGVIVAGASSHPGKFGFVAYHNLRRFGYAGRLFAVNRDGAEILGTPSLPRITDVPRGAADLVVVCTPVTANVQVLRDAAAVGCRAAFVATGGYRESGPEGAAAEAELVRTADELGLLLAGPNGQGVVSTDASLCAQIVAPYPPPGRIAVVSQSGNVVSSLLNYAVATGVGVGKAVSAGNAAQTGLADYLAYFAADGDTDAVVTYLEGVGDGRRLAAALARLAARKPVVVVRGGAAAAGARAAASHTGSLASDDHVFRGVCRQRGVLRAPTVEEAFEWAACFATQPLPHGRRIAIVTTAGGWGVLAADAASAAGLDVLALPDDLRAAIDALVPSRWSRNNPIDPAGGETRETIPALVDLVASHPDVDAVLLVGIGIQANQAEVFRSGPFFPEHGLARIVEFHERQDRRYAEAAVEASRRHTKPVLVATELAVTDAHYGNAATVALRRAARLCHPSVHRAVSSLAALARYAEFRQRSDASADG